MPTTFRNGTEPDLPAAAAVGSVLVEVRYQLLVPVPEHLSHDPAAAELWAADHLARLPATDHDEWYVEDSERTTYTAQDAR